MTLAELDILGVRANPSTAAPALALMAHGAVTTEGIHTHTFQLDQFAEALATVVERDEDHVSYVLSGRAKAQVGEDDFDVEPGDALYVPKNTLHNFRIQGGEVFRIAVVFAPGRGFWTA